MRRIPVTRNFDPTQPIGYLILQDDVDIPLDSVFALQYMVKERDEQGIPTKHIITSVGRITDDSYQVFLRHEREQQETRFHAADPSYPHLPLARNPYEGVPQWEEVWKRLYTIGLHASFSSFRKSIYVFGGVYLGEVDEVATMSEEAIRAKIKGEQYEREQQT